MKQFWIKILLVLPIPLLVIGFNWLVDPVHLRNADEYEYGIARLILQGKPVTNISNPNEALYLKHYVAGLTNRKDVLALGSSRSKLIRSDSFPGLSFFNNSIGGAGLVDYLAIYQMYRQKKLLPSMAVIELSPWILKRDYSSIWKELDGAKTELEQQILPQSLSQRAATLVRSVLPSNFSEFLSFGYFQTSFYTWLHAVRHPSKHQWNYFAWEEGTLLVGESLLADGSTIYPEPVWNRKEQEHVTALAVEYGRKPIGIPDSLDADREKILEAFLDRLQQDGVQAILYLPPYHPRTYALMIQSEQNRIIVEAQRYFEGLARHRGLTLIGSYNPSDLSLDDTAFFDGSHPTPETVRRLFAGHIPNVRASEAAAPTPDTRIELAVSQNQNGLEVANGRPFFWMGNGDTCLRIRSSTAGVAVITFHADPGPSLPQTSRRNLLLRAAHGYSQSILIEQSMDVRISFPVEAGLNDACLTPLDKPSVLGQPNGDRRPLLIGVSNLQARLLPGSTIPRDEDLCRYKLGEGWYPIEWTGEDWLCWNQGRGLITVVAATNMTAFLVGEIHSVPRPNQVDVIVNGTAVDTLTIDWSEWAFHSFPPVRLALHSGTNTLELVSRNSAVTIPPDPRSRAIAIRNLGLSAEK